MSSIHLNFWLFLIGLTTCAGAADFIILGLARGPTFALVGFSFNKDRVEDIASMIGSLFSELEVS